MALAGEEFGAVEAEGFDADEDLAGLGGGDGALFGSVIWGRFSFFFFWGEVEWCWVFFFSLFFFLFLLEYRYLPLLS